MAIVLKEESYRIMGACFEVYNTMGCGFLEAVYQECLGIEFSNQTIPFKAQSPLELCYKGKPLQQKYIPDFICFEKIIVEIKGGPREEILELPDEALREALLNAIGHRDYRSTAYIQVHIFQDRVTIVSPGGLVSGLKLKDLGRLSRPRNLLLFSLMARMNLVEHIGSGIKRIREALHAYNLEPPLIEADETWFSITFRRKSLHAAIAKQHSKKAADTPSSKKHHEGVNEGVKRVLDFIGKTPGLRIPQISKALNIPAKTLERQIRKLREKGKIEFRGSPRTGGYWAV